MPKLPARSAEFEHPKTRYAHTNPPPPFRTATLRSPHAGPASSALLVAPSVRRNKLRRSSSTPWITGGGLVLVYFAVVIVIAQSRLPPPDEQSNTGRLSPPSPMAVLRQHSEQLVVQKKQQQQQQNQQQQQQNKKNGNAITTTGQFQVCSDIKLGPALKAQTASEFSKKWLQVSCRAETPKPPKQPRSLMPNRNTETAQTTTTDANTPKRGGHCTTIEALGELKTKAKANGIENNEAVIVFSNFPKQNMLAKAVQVAFYRHYPLRLSPDAIWLTIIQGLGKHISKDPEAHRSKLVDFEGKKKITVFRRDFVKGSKENNWTAVFPEFAQMVAEFIGSEKAATLTNDFSTSSQSDRICSNIAMMDTVKNYFEYELIPGCGIPSVELAGTPEDWIRLKNKARILDEFDLGWWTKELFPILDQFVLASQGSPDIKFWKNVCSLRGESGIWIGYITGWVQDFFPYENSGERSGSLGEWRKHYENGTGLETEEYNKEHRVPGWRNGTSIPGWHDVCGHGLKLESIPSSISQAPFVFRDLSTGRSWDMTFNGGLVAVLQHRRTLALEPVTGWAVLDHGERKSSV